MEEFSKIVQEFNDDDPLRPHINAAKEMFNTNISLQALIAEELSKYGLPSYFSDEHKRCIFLGIVIGMGIGFYSITEDKVRIKRVRVDED